MIKLLKMDFKRAIYNRQFVIVIAIGALLSLMQIYMEVIPGVKYYGDGASYFNPFVKWISNDGFNHFTLLFFMLLPVLASLPYSDSYWVDKHSGFNKSIYTRSKKKNYFISRYITNFIIGGIVVIIPLILNFYILMMLLPAVHPSIFDASLLPKDMFTSLFYFHPYLYVGVYLLLTFIFGGTFASMGLAVSAYCKNRLLVVTTPVLVYISMHMFELAGLPHLVPAKFLIADQPVHPINIVSISIIFFILFIGSLMIYAKGVSKDEGI